MAQNNDWTELREQTLDYVRRHPGLGPHQIAAGLQQELRRLDAAGKLKTPELRALVAEGLTSRDIQRKALEWLRHNALLVAEGTLHSRAYYVPAAAPGRAPVGSQDADAEEGSHDFPIEPQRARGATTVGVRGRFTDVFAAAASAVVDASRSSIPDDVRCRVETPAMRAVLGRKMTDDEVWRAIVALLDDAQRRAVD